MPVDTVSGPWWRPSPLVHLTNNWISLTGVVVVTTAAVFWLFLLPSTLEGLAHHPYIGILSYLVVPAFFFLGLALIPLGIYRKERRERRAHLYPADFPPLNFRNREFRKLLSFFGVTTVINIVIASQLAYGAVTYMDSVTFCGETCHTIMQPEYTAYQNSPHSRVECVGCHIGPGASWFVRSKLSGTGQVFAALLHTYPRPIPTPVRNLRPARETCEACHWPQKYGEDRIRVVDSYADDAANTHTRTVLLMKIGGGNRGIGIHGTHLGPGVRIFYRPSDESRQTIPWVEYNKGRQQTLYQVSGVKPDTLLPMRLMDCMDCHNRPSHTYELPDRAVNGALASGDISLDLPFAKRQALELLRTKYADRADAAKRIPAAFENFYRTSYADAYGTRRNDIARSAAGVLAIYNRNIFPAMNVTWGTYPNNVGHTDYPGCFRCHDNAHTGPGDKAITQDCGACHNLLAVDEAQPRILTDLGITEAKPPAQR
jgi:hypothetical protein